MNLDWIEYLVTDIVEDLIKLNKENYQHKAGVEVRTGNFITDDLPNVYLILCRDCLFHFSYADIQKALCNFKRSGAKSLLKTSFINHTINTNIQICYWRPINLNKSPFTLSTPRKIINEKFIEVGEKYKDKSLMLIRLYMI